MILLRYLSRCSISDTRPIFGGQTAEEWEYALKELGVSLGLFKLVMIGARRTEDFVKSCHLSFS